MATLTDAGKLDNTLLLFLSGNGGCAEPYTDLGGREFEKINDPSFSGAVSYGQGWANASNTPFRLFKVWVNEGGISTPLIAHWPAGITEQRGTITDAAGYLPDIVPTVLEVTGASYPRTFNGRWIHPLEGQSLVPSLKTGQLKQHEWMFWEHSNNSAVRYGDYKALRFTDIPSRFFYRVLTCRGRIRLSGP